MEPFCKKSWQPGYFIHKAKTNADLIENARKLIQDFRNARSEIGDDCPSLVDTATELDELDKSVIIVQQEDALQTAAVMKEIKHVIKKVHYMSWNAVRVAGKTKGVREKQGPQASVPKKHFHTFRPMPKWLIKDTDKLDTAILCAQVGLVGTIEGRFEIQHDTLFEMSAKVKEALGIDLVLATRLRDSPTIIIDVAASGKDFQGERVNDPSIEKVEDGQSGDEGEDCSYDNLTLDQARAIAGDTGVQGWSEAAKTAPPRRRPLM